MDFKISLKNHPTFPSEQAKVGQFSKRKGVLCWSIYFITVVLQNPSLNVHCTLNRK